MEVNVISNSSTIYLDYYEIGLGLILMSLILLIFSLVLFSFDSFVHSWIQWVILALLILLFIGIGLLIMYYKYNTITII